jgi:DNA-binding CsgD family transcriptional regulator
LGGEEPGSPAADSVDSHAWHAPLTRREREIAGLVAQGLSNKDIGARLVISPRTAEAHVQHVLSKLGLASRLQVADLIAGQNGTGVEGACAAVGPRRARGAVHCRAEAPTALVLSPATTPRPKC